MGVNWFRFRLAPYVHPMGRTCGEPNETKKIPHPTNITVPPRACEVPRSGQVAPDRLRAGVRVVHGDPKRRPHPQRRRRRHRRRGRRRTGGGVAAMRGGGWCGVGVGARARAPAAAPAAAPDAGAGSAV